ncbi:hypothetical protein KIW84_020191 [Lathyrus oleraceus]|uniref:DEK-C domain-containing protein n=1 Tax=Pisum sativum TaxID=3888 RepID=A0A9D5B3S2_PEA|nr:hypothetical protein KIW84_020191 [Pisum sativum]
MFLLQEKQMIKVKEKFDKCNKEKLLDVCDVLDIQVAKANTRKEDIIAKLINFLVAPHVTRAVLLEEQEKSIKGKKRKRITKQGSSRSGASTSKRSAKSRKKNEDSSEEEERKTTTDTESDSEKEEENEKGFPDRSEDERPQKSESEDKSDSDNESEDVKKVSKINKTFSREKESAAKGKAKETTFQKKPRTPRKRTNKSLSTHSESDDDISEVSPKVFSRKKKNEKQKTSTLTKSSSKDNTEKVTKRKGKNKEKSKPSDDQLRNAICDIFKQVDFNTATFTDILKLLGKQFDTDLTPRKASLMTMIQEELTKLADEDEEDSENDETHTSGKEVEA